MRLQKLKKCAIIYLQDNQTVAWSNSRGKSEHHRTGRRLTTGGGDFKESGTEINRRRNTARMER